MSQNSVYSHHSVCTLCPHVLPSAGWRKGQCSQVVTLGQSLRNVIPEKYWVLTLSEREEARGNGKDRETEKNRHRGTGTGTATGEREVGHRFSKEPGDSRRNTQR